MARLWIETKSDLRKGTGKGASERAVAQIFWGSAGDSKLAGEINVHWPKGSPEPTNIHVTFGEKENPLDEEAITYSDFFKDSDGNTEEKTS